MVSSNNDNRPARLLMPHDEAKSVLRDRIGKGEELLARAQGISSQGQLDDVRSDYNKWSDYNCEFLRQKFSDDSYVREYAGSLGLVLSSSSFSRNVRTFHQHTRGKVDKLESFLERLDLIPSTVAASANENAPSISALPGNSVFIVHGHDDGAKQAVARMIDRLGLSPIILDEQPQAGRTIIEKVEEYADGVGFAIVLLTPDDVGAKAGDAENLILRARQNVIFELGFFVGRLGRGKVCLLYKQGVEIPSDYYGVGYVEMDGYGGWRLKVADELRSAGLPVDLNDL